MRKPVRIQESKRIDKPSYGAEDLLHAQVHVREPLLAILGHRVPHAHLVELDRAARRRLRARDLRPLRLPVVLGVESRGGPSFPAHQTEDRREDQTDNTESLRLVVVPWRFRGTFWRAKVLAARSSCARILVATRQAVRARLICSRLAFVTA